MLGADKLWRENGWIHGVIHGTLPNKSNARQIVYVKGKPLVIKSKGARGFEGQFAEAVAASNLDGLPLIGASNQTDLKRDVPKLFLSAVVWQESLQRDLDIELLCDVLQKGGVINNDRALWSKAAVRQIDKLNPRVEFVLGIL